MSRVHGPPQYGMYGPAFQPPSPPRPWSWVSHSTVPLPLWWGRNTEHETMNTHVIYIYIHTHTLLTLYIYMYVYTHTHLYIYILPSPSQGERGTTKRLAIYYVCVCARVCVCVCIICLKRPGLHSKAYQIYKT